MLAAVLTRVVGLSYVGGGVGLVLFLIQECRRFDAAILASPYFLIVPVLLSLSVLLIAGGISWLLWGRSHSNDQRVRAAAFRVDAMIILSFVMALIVANLLTPGAGLGVISKEVVYTF